MTIYALWDHDGKRITTELIDGLTTKLIWISHEHNQIHEGDRLVASDYVSNLAHNGTKYYKLQTGAKPVHFVARVNVDNTILFQILEGSTVTVNGTAMPFYNRLRGNITTALSTAFQGSTVTVDGTVIYSIVLGGRAAEGQIRQEDEWILLPNTVYVIKLDNSPGANATDATVNFDIYEEV